MWKSCQVVLTLLKQQFVSPSSISQGCRQRRMSSLQYKVFFLFCLAWLTLLINPLCSKLVNRLNFEALCWIYSSKCLLLQQQDKLPGCCWCGRLHCTEFRVLQSALTLLSGENVHVISTGYIYLFPSNSMYKVLCPFIFIKFCIFVSFSAHFSCTHFLILIPVMIYGTLQAYFNMIVQP